MNDEIELTDEELQAAAEAEELEQSTNEQPDGSQETPAGSSEETPKDAPTTGDTGKNAKSILDAINEGINEGAKSRKITPKSEANPDDDQRERNPDGTFKEKKAETPEEKAAREAAEAEAAKKPADHINDPIDPKLNERTQTRIKSLIKDIKDQQALVESHTQLFDAIQSTGASPEEFATMVTYMKGVRTGNPADLDMAYKILQSELVGLAVRMGKPLYEVNLLRNPENADLVKEINEGKLTANRAHEISIQREAAKRVTTQKTQQQTQQRTQEQEQQDYATAQAAAKTELDKLDTLLRTRDGDEVFQAKYDILVPQLEAIFPDISPKLWKTTFQKAYERLKLPAKVVPTVVTQQPQGGKTPTPKQQPLRPKTPSGGGGGNVRAEPKSALEAINQALDGA